MALTKNQRFGLISFLVFFLASILVTMEPWKHSTPSRKTSLESSLAGAPPEAIRVHWETLEEGYPQSCFTDTVHSYTGFDLAYNETFEQAAWVAYVLTREEAESATTTRTDDFRSDTATRDGSATLSDYRGSGYDRGHLAPAGDMQWSSAAMSESFLLSNMSPQDPSFNRGIWMRLEERVRDWAVEKESLYVVTGPVLTGVRSTIGENEVGVPAYFFKVLVDLSPPGHSFIAFLLPNEGSKADPFRFAISVDSLECFTGYDFFAAAPNPRTIEWLESKLDFSEWQ